MSHRLLVYAVTLTLFTLQEEVRFKVDVRLKTVNVSVTERGQPVATLNKEDFELYEDGSRQEVRSVDVVASPHRILAISQCNGFEANDILLQKTFVRLAEGIRPQNRLALVEIASEI